MAEKQTFRWAFNINTWLPSEADILLAGACIQPEEKLRVSKFVYKQDFMSSLIGRLMMRKFVSIATNLPYSEVIFSRDKSGKPFLQGEHPEIDFNISHQGKYVVLAGHVGKSRVGIDVMSTVRPPNTSCQEFFRLMKRQFSMSEWENISSYSQQQQLTAFYRHWCLKESYVKNIGVGITVDLQKISFAVKAPRVDVGSFVTDTDLTVNGELIRGWVFEETMLDPTHSVAVAINLKGESYKQPSAYEFLSFENLMTGSIPLLEKDLAFYENFLKKEEKKF